MCGAILGNVEYILAVIGYFVRDISPQVVIVDRQVIFKATPVKLHSLVLDFLISISHLLRGNDVALIMHHFVSAKQTLILRYVKRVLKYGEFNNVNLRYDGYPLL